MKTMIEEIQQLLIKGWRPHEIAKKHKFPLGIIRHHEDKLGIANLRQARQVRTEKLVEEQKLRLHNTSTIIDFENNTKNCYSCGEVKPLDQFSVNRTRWHGLSEACKLCMNAYAKEHHKKTYVSCRKPKIPKFKPPKPEPYVLTIQERKIRHLLSSAKGRAKNNGLPYDDVSWEEIEIPEYCPVIPSIKLVFDASNKWNAASLDRIIPSKGYTRGNIQIMSMRANFMKNNSTAVEREAFAKWSLNNAVESSH